MSDTPSNLVAFAEELAAQTLVRYLQSQQIKVRYQFVAGEFAHHVVLDDPSQFEEARALTQTFVSEPSHPRYAAFYSPNMPLFGPKAFKQTPLVWTVLLICLTVYWISSMGGNQWVNGNLPILPLAMLSQTGEWWRLISPAFIHFSWLHILFNLLIWWQIGRLIEFKTGTLVLLALFAITGVFSNVAQLWDSGNGFGGLSGVVYGIIGFAWVCGRLNTRLNFGVTNQFMALAFVWLILGYTDLLWVNLANTAHTVGLVSGSAIGLLYAILLQKKVG